MFIELIGDVDEDMLIKTWRGICDAKGSDITAILSTYGGEVYYGLAVYDLLTRYKNVDIVCVGPVMSAGTIILQAGRMRLATPNAQFMLHYGEESNMSPSQAKHNTELFRLMKNMIAERAHVKPRTVTSWFKNDTYFSTKRALEVGLIDGIEGEDE